MIKEKYDADYISYVESGESAAVFVVRDIVKQIDTTGMWIDVISISTYDKKGTAGRKAFRWIVVELFPRKMTPKYVRADPYDPDYDPDYNKYLTWCTAQIDIEKQRQSGFHGEKYLVLSNLYNKNKNKFITVRTINDKIQIREPIFPEWKYRIQAVKKVNSEQVQYIESHKWALEDEIRKNGKPTLEILKIR